MENFAIGLLVGSALFVVALIFWARWSEKRRSEALEGTAHRLGMSFQDKDETLQTEPFAEFPLFQRGHSKRFKNVIKGEDLWLFGYQYVVGAGQHQAVYRQTVAAIKLEGAKFPAFRATPEGWIDKLQEKFGGQDIDFPEDTEFSRRYRLRGENEPAVERLFRADIRHHLLAEDRWCVEGRDEWLVMYRKAKRVAPDDIWEFAEKARRLAAVFEG